MTDIKKSLPTQSQTHQNQPLTQIAVAFMQDANNYVAGNAFRRVPVGKISDTYYTMDRSYWLRNDTKKRAPGAAAAEAGYALATATYTLSRDAIAHRIPDPIVRNADSQLDLERQGVQFVTQQLLTAIEVDWVSKFFAASIWDNTLTPSLKWNDANSDPIGDVKAQARTILQNTGFYPNVCVLGALTFDRLCEHPDILDRVKYTGTQGAPAQVNQQALAQLFNVDQVVVCRAIRNTSAEGTAASYGFIGGSDDYGLFYAPPSPGLMVPAAGYTFTWGGAGNPYGIEIKRYRDEVHESDIIEGNVWYQHAVISAALGSYSADVCD